MKLLIVTQVVDLDHPILGFFHRWIEEFAAQCDSVEVICLEIGRHDLPANVTVHSLGKEAGVSRFKYVWQFYKLIWQRRRHYDGVFVHMNQVYVLLGWLPWRFLRKRVGLWYMHGSTPVSLKIASYLVYRIFTGSPESFRLKRKNLLVTGHGIDTNHFKQTPSTKKTYDLITVGRITPSKNIGQLVEALNLFEDKTVTLCVVGAPVTEVEQQHELELKQLVSDRGLTDRVFWRGRVPQSKLPSVLQKAKVFVTTAQNGSLDKAVLEAMACGLPTVSMAPGTQSLPLGRLQVAGLDDFVIALKDTLAALPNTTDLVNYVRAEHSLSRLVTKLVKTYIN